MKTFAFLSMLLLAACSSPTYLVSNVVKVTSVTTINGHQVVEVCGVNNKGSETYAWYRTDERKMVGDTLLIR